MRARCLRTALRPLVLSSAACLPACWEGGVRAAPMRLWPLRWHHDALLLRDCCTMSTASLRRCPTVQSRYCLLAADHFFRAVCHVQLRALHRCLAAFPTTPEVVYLAHRGLQAPPSRWWDAVQSEPTHTSPPTDEAHLAPACLRTHPATLECLQRAASVDTFACAGLSSRSTLLVWILTLVTSPNSPAQTVLSAMLHPLAAQRQYCACSRGVEAVVSVDGGEDCLCAVLRPRAVTEKKNKKENQRSVQRNATTFGQSNKPACWAISNVQSMSRRVQMISVQLCIVSGPA